MKNYSTTVPARLDDEDEDKSKGQPSIQVDKHLFEARTVLITGPGDTGHGPRRLCPSSGIGAGFQ